MPGHFCQRPVVGEEDGAKSEGEEPLLPPSAIHSFGTKRGGGPLGVDWGIGIWVN